MVELPKGSTVVVDTSTFVLIGEPDNPKFQRFSEYVDEREVSVVMPERVYDELHVGGYGTSKRVEEAEEQGWLVATQELEYTKQVSEVMDTVRERMASITSRPENEIEKTDTALAGHAVQLVESERSDNVVVLLRDNVAEQAIQDAVGSMEYDEIEAVNAGSLLDELTSDDFKIV
ncbi:MAG: hypothetical protein SXQ77_03425 [Halobacteria archaeon]|nr:hypothetical protein [Halobacteria archaeon]